MTIDDLTPTERTLADSAKRGVMAEVSKAINTAHGAYWKEDRTIRAELIVDLCTKAEWEVAGPGVMIRGAKIVGALSFESLTLRCPLQIVDCWVEGEINLCDAETKLIRLSGSFLHGIQAERAHVKGAFLLDDGFANTGRLSLADARIDGNLSFNGGQLKAAHGEPALCATRLAVHGALFLKQRFRAEGAVDFVDACLGGSLEAEDSSFVFRDGVVFDATRLQARSFCFHRCLTEGEMRLSEAKIQGSASFDQTCLDNAATLPAPTEGGEPAEAPKPDTRRRALAAAGLSVGGNLSFERSEVFGMLDLEGAQIGRSLILNRARIHGSECRYALDASNSVVKGNVLGRHAVFAGGLALLHARIGGELDLEAASVSRGRERHALYAGEMQVGGGLFWRVFPEPATGTVDLRDAKVGQLYDDVGSWPTAVALRLHGFEYGSFGDSPMAVHDRLSWLRRQKNFNLGPYEQVIRVLRRSGHDKDAREVACSKHNDLRRARLRGPARWWNKFIGFTIGHGYKIERALAISAFIILVGMCVFMLGFHSGVMIPVKDRPGNYLPGHQARFVPHFNSLLYSIDAFVPLINFHQEEYWLPVGRGWLAWQTRYYMWFHILAGWTLTTLIVAALTGLVKKNE